jgi:hypothetical protein
MADSTDGPLPSLCAPLPYVCYGINVAEACSVDYGGTPATYKLSAPQLTDDEVLMMKVRCDQAYALFLKTKCQGSLSIVWENGVMTIAKVNQPADLESICAE